ncbi:hypothetical protein Z043_101105 [Scleropages formosus]|uniref:Uncharacterized protein n=1 Tax=Scleropages formosus TaxID=113540 RepID=A0A0P7VS84_SCLFO|nr:hypothetical protein Z043_101105 [Scleropages formosus]
MRRSIVAISRLDYSNSLLAHLLASPIKTLRTIRKTTVRVAFHLPKRSRVSLPRRSPCPLPVAARIKFNTLLMVYKTVNGSAP